MAMMLKAKEAAELVYDSVRRRVEDMRQQGVNPHMAVVLVEGDPASAYYAKAKQKVAGRLGVSFQIHGFNKEVSEEELIEQMLRLNADPHVHGIMLELPLPGHLSAEAIVSAISPLKDVDGVTPRSKLATMSGGTGIYPATPQACIRLLRHYGYSLEGKNVTLVGRGQTVGLPLFHMLQREQATVTVCHSRTPDLKVHLLHAEIAFVAVGRPQVVTADMVHPRLVVVDAGINETADGSIVGDAAPDLCDVVSAVSPVPGGVGTLTTAILFENLLKAISLQNERKEAEL